MSCAWYAFLRGYKTSYQKEIWNKPKNFIYCPFCEKEIVVKLKRDRKARRRFASQER